MHILGHTRKATLTTAALAAAALTAVAATPAEADGDRGDRGDQGDRQRGYYSFVLTEDATSALDEAGAELTGVDGARVRRTSDDLLAVYLGRAGHRHGSGEWGSRRTGGGSHTLRGGFTVTDAATTTWTDIKVDRREGVITADVDSVEDVDVFTIVEDEPSEASPPSARLGGYGGSGEVRSDATLELTGAAADALDRALGAEVFDAGDVFATTSGRGCGR